ncbi:hypothetical protein [Streptomyces litmocidini]|uniref:hypothetical protein n=2 Tax=Streptomyces litmocidini TaxID=67318 RepID=UPI0036F94C5A
MSAHRGHGLGLWLKASVTRTPKDTHPGIVGIETDNADDNPHMLTRHPSPVTRRPGFRPQRIVHEYQPDLPGAGGRIEEPRTLGPHGNDCYHAGMAKTQLGARVDEDVAELAKKRAADLGLSVGDYLARLVQDDASGLRARAVEAAARFLAEHQAVFDEAEQAQRAPRETRAA